MKNIYIKPTIVVIKDKYNECQMQSWSSNIGSGGGTTSPPPSGSKPGGEWGNNTWTETKQPKESRDDWGM